jgi:hypothetical protein
LELGVVDGSEIRIRGCVGGLEARAELVCIGADRRWRDQSAHGRERPVKGCTAFLADSAHCSRIHRQYVT